MQPQSQEFLYTGYYEDSKGYKLINLSKNKSFIERSVQFQEEHLAAVEVGESSSPPEPLNVSGETNEFDDSDMSDNDNLIAYPNNLIRPKWAAKTIHAAGELAGNPSDPRRTRSQLKTLFLYRSAI